MYEIFFPDKWSPALQIRTVLLSVQALLSAPNPDDPLASDVAKHYKVSCAHFRSSLCLLELCVSNFICIDQEDEKDAQRVSKQWTAMYATGS